MSSSLLLLSLLSTFSIHLNRGIDASWHPSAQPHYDVIVPMVMRDRGWEGLVAARREGWLQTADFDHVMDPEIGQQILQARPAGGLPNCMDTNGIGAI
ncbi:hypothetical protein PBY51_016974 [Eleginops maclovinus]|uniref:Uncharacterized protein n=1 Tax=Eleginops maclovinus TaxID=56733 RepID=A0AAN7WRE3_ELEMC|nr:hypothetical protein PBY51_016974 [Eleginops maclovinus]